MNSYSLQGKSVGSWNELEVLHLAQLSHVSQPKELHHTVESVGLQVGNKKNGSASQLDIA